MSEINIRNIDLNLLTVFEAIYGERQITRAAASLGLTQPAVSHALGRLRELLGDPLFIRGRARMEPTPRAHQIAGPVAEILDQVRDIVGGPGAFDPATARRELRLGMLDYGMAFFAPEFAKVLSVEAPGLTLDCRHMDMASALDLMADGALDLALGPFGEIADPFERRSMIGEDFVVAARAKHPRLRRYLDLRTYVELPHVALSNLADVGNRVDAELKERGLTRKVFMTVPHYSAALIAASKSDLIATVPRGPAEFYRGLCDLALYPPPVTIAPLQIHLVRYRRFRNDPVMDWLWDRLGRIAAEMTAIGPPKGRRSAARSRP
jgi:DNA-binding transcriptional LysR family regulator